MIPHMPELIVKTAECSGAKDQNPALKGAGRTQLSLGFPTTKV